MSIFIINRTDISKHIVVGTYQINAQDVFEEWVDGNYNNRREVIRDRVAGTFEVYFRNKDEYSEFVQLIEESKTEEGWMECEVAVNNRDKMYSNRAIYIKKMEPMRDRAITGRDYFPQFEVEIEER